MYYNCKLGGRYSELPPLEVYQYQINGTFIKKWNTKTACEFYKISTNSLRTAISTKGLCAGFYWTREYSDIIDISKFGNPNLPNLFISIIQMVSVQEYLILYNHL